MVKKHFEIKSNNNKMNLLEFLISKRVSKGKPFSHTSLAPRKMTYMIDDEELPIDGRTQKFVVNRDGKVEEG